MSTVRPSAVPDTRPSPVRRRRIITVAVAVVLGLIGWTIASPVLGVPMRVRVTPDAPVIEVNIFSVLIAGLLVGLIGAGLLALLERFTTRARLVWTIAAVVVLLVSLAGPLGGVKPSTVVALICLHLLVGGVLIVGFGRTVAEEHTERGSR